MSSRSRRLLLDMLSVCHRVVMTNAVAAEWKRHASEIASRWLVRMERDRKVFRPSPGEHSHLANRLRAATPANSWAEIEKDMHLLEAALATDHTIISRDTTMRGILTDAASKATSLQSVAWVGLIDAFDSDEEVTEWLEEGAPARDEFLLTPPGEE